MTRIDHCHMIVFTCHVCRTPLSADDHQGGQLVRCPTCATTLRVPVRETATATVGAGAGGSSPDFGSTSLGQFGTSRYGGRRYGFNCGYCSSRLEATEGMAAQEGQCPTCGNNITIPILDRYGRLIDPKTREIIKQDPHPVHAYAAAGDRAPKIIRQGDGRSIQCPRCTAISPITANNCKACGMPFTMEGTTLEAAGANNGFCVAALVLGIISIPAACAIIPGILAIIFGIIGYSQVARDGAEGGGRGMAIAGIICGAVGTFLALMLFVN
jgi:LSD1 subclass zinc finger protein